MPRSGCAWTMPPSESSAPEKSAIATIAIASRIAATFAVRNLLRSLGVVGDYFGDAAGQPLSGRYMQELVGPVRVRMRPEQAGDEKLRLREAFPEHRHERNRAALAHEGDRLAEKRL